MPPGARHTERPPGLLVRGKRSKPRASGTGGRARRSDMRALAGAILVLAGVVFLGRPELAEADHDGLAKRELGTAVVAGCLMAVILVVVGLWVLFIALLVGGKDAPGKNTPAPVPAGLVDSEQ